MFSENEVATLAEIPEISALLTPLKKEFCEAEAPYFDISNHDFLALVLMTPSVGVALANGSVSLFEELALNKMARRNLAGSLIAIGSTFVHLIYLTVNTVVAVRDRVVAAYQEISRMPI